jgi:fatty-acyl-CoA synthase
MSDVAPIREVLRSAWKRHADRTALVTPDGSSAYAELEDRSLRLANVLATLGAGPDRAVGCVVTPDSQIQLDVRFATYELGATLFAMPPNLLTAGHQFVKAVDPGVVVYDPHLVPGLPEWLIHVCPDAHALPARASTGDYGGLLATAPATPIENEIDPCDLTAVGFTSGTTGSPKGITATHEAAAWSCSMMRDIFSNGDEVGGLLAGIPLFAAGGGVVVPTLAGGGTLYSPHRFDAVEALHLMDRGLVRNAFLTPSMIIDMLDVPDLSVYDLSGVHNIVYGTSIMPVPKLDEAIRRIGPVFMGGYGMAEVLPPVTVLSPGAHGTRSAPACSEVLSSVGKPVDGVSVRIVDEDGIQLPLNTAGEVEIMSPAVTAGYWGDIVRTRAAMNDEWWRSGDTGYLDDDHRLHILSRNADLIWRGGDPIYPRHLEELCSLHPWVKEACAVQDRPDGPIVVAVSLRSSGCRDASSQRITAALHDLFERQTKVSVAVDDIMVFDEIPRSVQGKVLHREVRAAVTSQGGAGAA